MQRNDRHQLITRIIEVVEDLYGSGSVGGCIGGRAGVAIAGRGEAGSASRLDALRKRLNPLLDLFPSELEPIVETQVTILLADIRGFSALTRSMPAERLIHLLNRYFAAMCQVVKRHDGFIDKFMGDCVMALFGVPQPRPNDLQRALACSVEMQQAMAEMNRQNQLHGEPRLYAGIAVNTGQVMAGSFGSEYHNEYTVIGDAVNLASRIESFSLRGQVLLSEASRTAAGDLIDIGGVNQVHVKGIAAPISLYELRAVHAPRRLVVPKVDVRSAPRIAVTIDAVFRQVKAQRVRGAPFVGQIKDMGYFGMRADLPVVLPVRSEVVVNLGKHLTPPLSAEQEVYARVVSSERKGPSFLTRLEFTAIDTPGHRQVKQYVDDRLWQR